MTTTSVKSTSMFLDTGPSTSRMDDREGMREMGDLQERGRRRRQQQQQQRQRARGVEDNDDYTRRIRSSRSTILLPRIGSISSLLTLFLVVCALPHSSALRRRWSGSEDDGPPGSSAPLRWQTASSSQQQQSAVVEFYNSRGADEQPLEKMVVDPSTGRVYVGGVNHLYDLRPDDLSVHQHVETGPREDSVDCADRSSCAASRRLTNAHSKALAIFAKTSKLIECTSLFQGVVSNSAHPASTSLFVVPAGPADGASEGGEITDDSDDSSSSQPVVYAASSKGDGTFQEDRPALAALSLSPDALFETAVKTLSGGTEIKLERKYRDLFRVDYVGGFQSGRYAYFATRQPKGNVLHSSSSGGGVTLPTESRLVRVCTGDAHFYSYAELPLVCEDAVTREAYNLVTDVHVAKPGYDLANSMGLRVEDDVLFATFVRGERKPVGSQAYDAQGQQHPPHHHHHQDPSGLSVDGSGAAAAARHSALCIYAVRDVEAAFRTNIEACYRGDTKKNLPWFKSDEHCVRTQLKWTDVQCGKDVNIHIGGREPLRRPAILTSHESRFTAVAVNTTQSSTVAFVGTHDGVIIKAVIENATSAFVYGETSLGDTRPILQDMEFDGTGTHLYAMTPAKVSKLRVSDCDSVSTECGGCLASRDPYCGWCVHTSQCTNEPACEKTLPHVRDGWLHWRGSQCPTIKSVTPDRLPMTSLSSSSGLQDPSIVLQPHHLSPAVIDVRLENLGRVSGRLLCEFHFAEGGQRVRVEPNVVRPPSSGETQGGSSSLRCPAPPARSLPAPAPGAAALEGRLVVIASDAGGGPSPGSAPIIASHPFTFYDCARFDSCSACTSSPFPCDWCVESAQCVAGTSSDAQCRSQHLINGKQREGPSSRKGPSFCAHMVAAEHDIHVASGEPTNVSVRVKKVEDWMRDFRCIFRPLVSSSTASQVVERKAHRKDDLITCEPVRLESVAVPPPPPSSSFLNRSRETQQSATPVELKVVWSSADWPQAHALDNTQRVRVMVYRCADMATNCGQCLALNPAHFDCGWCSATQQCVRRAECPAALSGGRKSSDGGDAADWLDGRATCPHPAISGFHPRKGPLAGNTLLVIQGVNLGRRVEDVQNAVTTANVRCRVVDPDYVVSSRIVCRTEPAPLGEPTTGPVVVKLRDSLIYTAISSAHFEYVEPDVQRVSPNTGPRSGGTEVVLHGRDLDAGSNVSISFGNVACHLIWRTPDKLKCRTAAATHDGARHLKLDVDGSVRTHNKVLFTFERTPVVHPLQTLRTTISGGIALDVPGERFRLLQRPALVVTLDNVTRRGADCTVVSDVLMVCQTPSLRLNSSTAAGSTQPYRRGLPTVEHPLAADYGFDFDGVLTGNLSQTPGFKPLLVEPDPQLQPFADTRLYRVGEFLTISGKNIDAAASDRDINVTVGGEECRLNALADKVLSCLPPPKRPQLSGDLEPEVVVQIGHRRYSVGILSYDSRWAGLSPGVAAVAGVFLAALIALLVVLLVCYRRKSTSHNRQLALLKSQMDTIEMKVAAECKEAFAELQTSLNAFAAELPFGTPAVPFLPYADYTARVLFPSPQQASAVLRELEVATERAAAVESGLRELHRLLLNRTFLLSFVRTMEANKYFVSRDRVYVGSLLMVVLQDKMWYCTEVLKQLTRELIERTVEKKLQPKILFRRSESVAERMLSVWFAFLLHGYLKECAGKRLHDLYWAIKQQMEKGPQDAITYESKYSLSEEKLLRASVDYREMTVFVAADQVAYAMPDLPVRVLDCDTITQVKEKCIDAKWRAVPHSERPSAAELELEWRTGVNGRLVLHDLDATSRTDAAGWRRLNTLAHYQVPEHAVLALVGRTASLYNLSLLSSKGVAPGHHSTVVAGDGTIAMSTDQSSASSGGGGGGGKSSSSPYRSRGAAAAAAAAAGRAAPSPPLPMPPYSVPPRPLGTSSTASGFGLGAGGTSASGGGAVKDVDNARLMHLVRPTTVDGLLGATGVGAHAGGMDGSGQKLATEIYLTRLLMMKGTLHAFINDLLEAIFSVDRSYALPAAVKYMFDFLDDQAAEHSIQDPDVVHAWKSNALPLRFWVNLIKNPHFLFDIPKPTKVEGSLSVVAQTLMDACSTQDQPLTKDSPSSKLLFAKDMPTYRQWVDSYYSSISRAPRLAEQDMAALLEDESRAHRPYLHVYAALNELYKYLEQYKQPLLETLEAADAQQQQQGGGTKLAPRLHELLATMGGSASTASAPSSDYDSNTLGQAYNSASRLMGSRSGRSS